MTLPKMDTKSWVIGILVLLGTASTWLSAHIAGEDIPDSKFENDCAASHVVFSQKKRCGFLDLGELVTAEGLVLRSKTHTDGDRSIKIKLDEPFERLLYYGGRKNRDFLKVEFMPCERQYTDVESILAKVQKHYDEAVQNGESPTMRVRITGRWAYDGVDHRGTWKDQLGNCLGGNTADPEVG